MTDYVIVEPQPCNGIKFEGGVCKGGNTNVKRTATTNINKNYSVSYNTYLQKKCKTFKQKSNIGSSIDSDKNSYKITNCNTDKCNKTYYKPNNPNFSQQGAVSSSNRLLRLKNNTINQNGASFKTAFAEKQLTQVNIKILLMIKLIFISLKINILTYLIVMTNHVMIFH